jgi:hypothetical protein
LAVGADGTFAAHERAVLTAANAACRELLAATFQATAEAHPERVRVEDIEYVHHHEGTVTYRYARRGSRAAAVPLKGRASPWS